MCKLKYFFLTVTVICFYSAAFWCRACYSVWGKHLIAVAGINEPLKWGHNLHKGQLAVVLFNAGVPSYNMYDVHMCNIMYMYIYTCQSTHVYMYMYIIYMCTYVQYYVHVHIYMCTHVQYYVHVHCVPASIMFHNDSLQNVVQSIDLWSPFHYNCTSCTRYWQLYNWCCNVWCSSLDFKVHKLSLSIRKYQPHVLVLIMMGWGAMVML